MDLISVGQSLLLFGIAIGTISHDPGKPPTPGEMIAAFCAFIGLIVCGIGAAL